MSSASIKPTSMAANHHQARLMVMTMHPSVMMIVLMIAIVQLIALLGPVDSIIVTSVLAGDKKFKTVSFDSKFLPALKFEKPLLLPTEFRRHRTLRPPKFDIDVNIPIKLPMEEEYPHDQDDYQADKKPIESNIFFQTGDVSDDMSPSSYDKQQKKQQHHHHHSPPTPRHTGPSLAASLQKLYASASNDHQQQHQSEDNNNRQHQMDQQQVDNNPKSIQDILQRPEDKASNKFSDGIDGAADSSKINTVGMKQHQNNFQQQQQQHQQDATNQQKRADIASTPIVSALLRSPDRRHHQQRHNIMMLPLLMNSRSLHKARSLFQHHDRIDSRSSSSQDNGNYDNSNTNNNLYSQTDIGSSLGDQGGQESVIGYQPSQHSPSSSSSTYTSGDSNSPSPTSTYQHMGTQYYTRPGFMHHFQNSKLQPMASDSGQLETTYSGLTDQQTSNMNQDYLSTQMASDQNQQQRYVPNSGETQQQQQQQQFQQQQADQYSQQQQNQRNALINAYIMHQQQQQQLQSAAFKQQQQQQNSNMYPSGLQSSNSAVSSYSNQQQQQQQQDLQQPQSMSSELQPMVATGNSQMSAAEQNSDNSQSSGESQSSLHHPQYDSNGDQQMQSNLQQAESQHNDYQQQLQLQQQQQKQYGNNNDQQQQQYSKQEFVPGGFINLQIKGPEGGPKMTYADYDRERWAQQMSQATGSMPNHVLSYQQLQNYYGGLGTFTNGLTDRYVGPIGILDKLKSNLHTIMSKFHLG